MKHVERKQVYRWYTDGKGFGSRRGAYKKIAVGILRREVFGGEGYPLLNELEDQLYDLVPGYDAAWGTGLTNDQRSQIFSVAWDELMADKFPHGNHHLCSLDFNGTCRRNGLGPDYYFVHRSCKSSIDQWINDKIKELQADDA